jgi:hypothetical protein
MSHNQVSSYCDLTFRCTSTPCQGKSPGRDRPSINSAADPCRGAGQSPPPQPVADRLIPGCGEGEERLWIASSSSRLPLTWLRRALLPHSSISSRPTAFIARSRARSRPRSAHRQCGPGRRAEASCCRCYCHGSGTMQPGWPALGLLGRHHRQCARPRPCGA